MSNRLLIVVLLTLVVACSVQADVHNVVLRSAGPAYDFDVTYLAINIGDTVNFYNYSNMYTDFYSYDGTCPSWSTGPVSGQPYPAFRGVTFNDGPCTTEVMETAYFSTMTIEVFDPSTPTWSGPRTPAMSPTGSGLAIIIISVLMGIAVIRKR